MIRYGEPAASAARPTQARQGEADGGLARIGLLGWGVLILASLATFGAFMLLDPEPSLVLSVSAAVNLGLILFAIYQLWRWDLLLSPAASVVIGPGLILFYSWGNLGARIAGEGRLGSNPGSLEFYPTAALLTSVGLALFDWAVFGLFVRQLRSVRIRYQDLYWQPWQAPVASAVAVGLLVYLSAKYPFVNGYFREVESDFDRWLSATHYFFVLLAVLIGVSVTARSSRLVDRLLGIAAVVLPLLLAVGLRSRTFMVTVVVTSMVCWVTLRPRRVRAALVMGALAAVSVFSLGTVVKTANLAGSNSTVADNLTAVSGANLAGVATQNVESAGIDVQYRLAGFEYPAALIGALERGASPMYGEGMFGGMVAALPGFLRPPGEYSERIAIFKHFYGRGIAFGDSIGVPLTSGLADWGILPSPLIYFAIAVYCILLWRVVQRSPRLFLAYLMAGVGPGDLFWENGLFAIRAVGFSWLALWFAGPLLMPRWHPVEPGESAARAAGSSRRLGAS